MAVITSNREPGDVALEDHVRRLGAAGLSDDEIADSLTRAGARGGHDALWLYSRVITGRRRDGVGPRAEIPSLE